ncbi:MAG: response regulator [Bacteroidales bacterium]|nr:response regulator [Bacteroidales bacterium]
MNIPDFKNRKILIVEDDPVSMELLNELLLQTGASLLFADNGQSSIDVFDEHKEIDIILMDIQLPVLSGTDAMKRIKEKNPETIVIAQTAFAMASDKSKYLNAGFDDYVSKPVLPDNLYQVIGRYFK